MWIFYVLGYLVFSWVVLGVIALYERGKIKWVQSLAETIWGVIYYLISKIL